MLRTCHRERGGNESLLFSFSQLRFVCRLKFLHCNRPRSFQPNPGPSLSACLSKMCFAQFSHKFCLQLRPSFFQDLSQSPQLSGRQVPSRILINALSLTHLPKSFIAL
jgi:hypothetical protein